MAEHADIDGDGKPELLLPQKNFLRAVVLQPDAAAAKLDEQAAGPSQVKEQINGAASNSRLVGAAAVAPTATNAVPRSSCSMPNAKSLTLCERDSAGVWQVVRNLPLPVSEFTGLQAVALGGASEQRRASSA